MLGLVPPGADAEVELTDADVVDGHCPFRQDRRMAIDHTGYQRDDPRPLGNSCHGGQRRPALERRLGEFCRPTKMVVVPNSFEAKVIRGLPQLLQCGVFEAQVELDRYPHAAIFRPLRCVCGAVIEYQSAVRCMAWGPILQSLPTGAEVANIFLCALCLPVGRSNLELGRSR